MRLALAFFVVVLVVGLILFTDFGDNSGRYYDCRLSEISPDFPTEVKEECRRIRLEEHKKNKLLYV
jgi:hypothetical protein